MKNMLLSVKGLYIQIDQIIKEETHILVHNKRNTRQLVTSVHYQHCRTKLKRVPTRNVKVF